MRPETWLDELAVELAARGVSPTDAAEIVVEAEGHLQDAAAAPLSAFGSPAKYAALVVDALEPPSAAPPTGRVRVQAHAISKWDVLRDQDVELRDGQALLLMGANGAGKTTLLRILAGLLSPDAGELTVAGSIGYAPQDGGLIEHLKPAEHFVLFGRGRGLTRTQAIREGARLADQLGWDALAAPTVGKLSGGTRQKLNVVLAALGEPDILLLDEPYQGLDRDSVQRFWELLWTWRDQGRCALVASHAHDAVERADAVLELQ